jgi:ABC-type multidrug transport system fused ATPase/permease subunit
MDIINILFKYFYREEKFNIILLIILNLILNIFKINIISYIISNIIKSIENNNFQYVQQYYQYLVISFIFFIIIWYYFKKINNQLLIKIRNWGKLFLLKNIYYNSNEKLLQINYSKLSLIILRSNNLLYYFLLIIFNKVIPNILLIFIIFGFFIYKHYKIGLIFLVGNILLLLYLYNNYDKLVNYFNIVEKKTVDNELDVHENLNNISKIILKGQKNNEINIINNNITNINNIGFKFINLNNNKVLVCNIIIHGLILIIIGYLIYLYSNKNISTIIFITFITILLLYRDLILTFIQEIPFYIDIISRAMVLNTYFDKNLIFNLFNNDDKKKNNIKLKNNIEFNNIEFKNLNFKYESESTQLFNNLNLNMNIKNKIIGLTGLSGNGKSTIIKLLLKLYPYKGDILIDNINIQDIDVDYLRKNILYVDQSLNLFDKKVIENINYGIDNENDIILSKKYFYEIMKYSTIKHLYLDIDFKSKDAGFNGENLSGGQRQVINLINSLITPSVITVLDEPTNALDSDLKKDVIQIIKDFKKYNKCIIIITHDKDLYEIFDENIIL